MFSLPVSERPAGLTASTLVRARTCGTIFNYFELMNAINASISASDKPKFGICVSDFASFGFFNRIRKISGLAKNS